MRAPERNDNEQPPSRIPWPLILVAASIKAGLVVDRLAPIPLPWPSFTAALGGLIVALALVTGLRCASTLWRRGATALPQRPAARLVTEGPFRVSRNPIYISHTAFAAGLGLMLGSA